MRLAPRLGLSLAALATSAPQLAPAASAHLGLTLDAWWVGLRVDVALPSTQTVLVAELPRGTFSSFSLSASLSAGRCFGGALRFCPALSAGVRVLAASAEGRLLYRPTSLLAAIPTLGVDLPLQWQLSRAFALLLHVSPWFPLGQLSASVEGTTAQARTGALEGVVGLGVLWSPQAPERGAVVAR